jgi:hypothetical protein
METALTRKESKRAKRRDENEEQPASEERTKERKHRKKRDGKRKKKRSSVPNLDEGENSQTLGQDNQGLDHEETMSVKDQAIINVAESSTSVDLTSRQGSEIVLQDGTDKSIGSRISQGSERVIASGGHVSQETASLNATHGQELKSRSEDDHIPSRQGSAGSEQGLRRRATLTEMGKSFDEEQVRYLCKVENG